VEHVKIECKGANWIQMACCCQHVDGPSGSITDMESLYQLWDY